ADQLSRTRCPSLPFACSTSSCKVASWHARPTRWGVIIGGRVVSSIAFLFESCSIRNDSILGITHCNVRMHLPTKTDPTRWYSSRNAGKCTVYLRESAKSHRPQEGSSVLFTSTPS